MRGGVMPRQQRDSRPAADDRGKGAAGRPDAKKRAVKEALNNLVVAATLGS
jgi:hypothetical protein